MELETRRLLLRPLRDDDAIAMAQALNNFNVSRNLARVKFPYAVQDAQTFIDLQRTFDLRSAICAITFRAAPDELIGMVTYEYDEKNPAPELGYWLRECCWNMGIMSEAATALAGYAFTQGGVDALRSGYHIDNPNSGRILRRLGFVELDQEMNFSLAQNKEIPVMKLRLTRESWLAGPSA